ncbi:transketolase-like [Argonauta hians]
MSAEYHRPDAKTVSELKDLAHKLRIHSIKATDASNSGHPTSCCSAAEIVSVLFFHTMKYEVSNPRGASNDRFILSKGHAAPILYAAWAEAGLFPAENLLDLRKITSDLEGHPTPRLNFIDVGTGSLGQGLSIAAGMAYTGKYFDKGEYRVYCLIGDGESAEGSIWEAMAFASYYKLNNLVAILDVNRLGQSAPTPLQHDVDVYVKRCEAFGWNTYAVDGHDVESLCKAFDQASSSGDRPTCIVAKTFKGKNIPNVEDLENWHGKPLTKASETALESLKNLLTNPGPHTLNIKPPVKSLSDLTLPVVKMSEDPSYELGQQVATRLAYGTALVKLGNSCDRVVAMDGDTKNSTFAITYMKAFPERFIECFIAEQNLVGVGIGCACRNRTIPFISTFACFLTRAYDQIRMAAISQSNANFCGSHAGISIGEDGPSQMALEDLSMFRSIPGSTVFYPSDAVSCERAIELAANTKGICFIRTSRPNVPVIYSNTEEFKVGQAKIVRQKEGDRVTVVASCVTLVEAVKAAELLESDNVSITIIDPFTVKPIDGKTIYECAKKTGGKILTVEDHYAEGGIGEAVCSAMSEYPNITVKRLSVLEVPRSGKAAELMDKFGISAKCIVKAVHQMATVIG